LRRWIGQPSDSSGADVGEPTNLLSSEQIAALGPLGSAAQALVTSLQSGCSQSYSDAVSQFQGQWNAAGSSPSLTVDGLYGADTASALTSFVQNNGLSGTVPAGCVATAQSSGTSTGQTFTAGQSQAGLASSAASVQASMAFIPWWGWAIAAAGVGFFIYEEEIRKKAGTWSTQPTYAYRAGKKVGEYKKRAHEHVRTQIHRARSAAARRIAPKEAT